MKGVSTPNYIKQLTINNESFEDLKVHVEYASGQNEKAEVPSKTSKVFHKDVKN